MRFGEPASPTAPTGLLVAALQATDQAFCVADMRAPDEPLVYVNPAFTAMTGYPAEAVLGRNCRFLQAGLDVATPVAEIRRLLRAGEPGVVVLPNRRADGTVFVNELSLAPVRDAAGVVTHVVGVQRDVTARTEAERARDALRAENDAIAEQLQEHLVPRVLPALAGWATAVRYRPAQRDDGSRGEVSGDFFDLVPRPDGGWFAVLGDVSGRGPRAAVVTTTLRWSVRGASAGAAGPAALLETVGGAVQDLLGERFATLAAVALPAAEPDAAGPAVVESTVALAGHPRPVLLPAAGAPRLVGTPGTLVGPFDVATTDEVVPLRPGDALVLYTDGVTEASAPDRALFDDAGLLAALAAVPEADRVGPRAADRLADALLRAVDRHLAGRAADDVLVLVVTRR